MKKDGNNFVDGNVVYPGKWLQGRNPNLQLVVMSPEQRRLTEDRLLGKEMKEGVNQREGYNLAKRLRQASNKWVLNAHKNEILASGPVRILHPEEDIVDRLDQQLTNDTNFYVWDIAKCIISAYRFESQEFTLFAKELLHPKELERYRYNSENREFMSGSQASRLNVGIALVVNRRFLPDENVKRYFNAKKIFDERLEGVALDLYKESLDYRETRIYGNPLFHYVIAGFQKNDSKKNLRSTDLV